MVDIRHQPLINVDWLHAWSALIRQRLRCRRRDISLTEIKRKTICVYKRSSHPSRDLAMDNQGSRLGGLEISHVNTVGRAGLPNWDLAMDNQGSRLGGLDILYVNAVEKAGLPRRAEWKSRGIDTELNSLKVFRFKYTVLNLYSNVCWFLFQNLVGKPWFWAP